MRMLIDLDDLPDGVKLAVSYLRVSTSAQADTDYTEEGFSLPAQRDANQRAAERLNAVIVAEFCDRGESAKSADRPELQAMLRFIKECGRIDYAIVHKVDRLARSREDDVAINLAIRQAGAQLVSATENIDATPSGRLLHGIMSTIAEFYSANLAFEAKKGMRQKAIMGGTPGLAPLGYKNVRQQIDSREIRTVAIDPDRAPLIQWMFDAYANGEWTLRQLEVELARRGLRIPATPKRPSRPVSMQHIDKMLTNRYYLGFVTFEGVEYDGRHPALIDLVTFERVQAVRTGRAETREKTQKHPHFLKGSVYCGYCGNRLGVTNARNRWGTVYPYFYCLGRQRSKSCTQRAVLIADVEAQVADHWSRVQLEIECLVPVRELVDTELRRRQARGQAEIDRQQRRIADLRNQQHKLIEARYADAIPLDLLKSEQQRINREITHAGQIIEQHSLEIEQVSRAVDDVLLLCADAHRLYASAPPMIKRQLNQAVFTRFWVTDDQVEPGELAEPFAKLLTLARPADEPIATDHGGADRSGIGDSGRKTRNPALDQREPGLNIHTLVDSPGLEP